jgi:hypothetical protein
MTKVDYADGLLDMQSRNAERRGLPGTLETMPLAGSIILGQINGSFTTMHR